MTEGGGAVTIADAITQQEVFCLVCGCQMEQTGAPDIFVHFDQSPCPAVLVDAQGESIDGQYFVAADGNIYERGDDAEPDVAIPADVVVTEPEEPYDDDPLPILPEAPPPAKKQRRKRKPIVPPGGELKDDGTLMLPLEPDPTIVPVETGLIQAFEKYGVPRLGGASGDLGWSSFSTFQRCPYLFKRLYVDGLKDAGRPSMGLEVGSLFHAFAAVYYQKFIDPAYPITPQLLYDALLAANCNVEALLEAWRLWTGYALYYEQDVFIPLAVEYHIVDPRTRESTRYDLIAKVEKADMNFKPGTFIVEHKSSGRFDDATLEGWANDGEVLGQIMLWKRLKLSKKFGKLVGVVMNFVGKQKIQRFERRLIPPQRWQIKQHANDLRLWQGLRQFIMASGVYPRARANCVGRYGRCSQWDHCAYRED